MRCVSKSFIKNKQIQKFILLALLLCFIITPLLSTAYIIIYTCHEHTHYETEDNCKICAQILTAKELLRQIGAVLKGITAAVINLFSIITVLYAVWTFGNFQTLVKLKIRMNN